MLISKIFIQKETPIQDVLISTAAAMIGMIPEGLVLLNSVAAVLGVIQLSKKYSSSKNEYNRNFGQNRYIVLR